MQDKEWWNHDIFCRKRRGPRFKSICRQKGLFSLVFPDAQKSIKHIRVIDQGITRSHSLHLNFPTHLTLTSARYLEDTNPNRAEQRQSTNAKHYYQGIQFTPQTHMKFPFSRSVLKVSRMESTRLSSAYSSILDLLLWANRSLCYDALTWSKPRTNCNVLFETFFGSESERRQRKPLLLTKRATTQNRRPQVFASTSPCSRDYLHRWKGKWRKSHI